MVKYVNLLMGRGSTFVQNGVKLRNREKQRNLVNKEEMS